MSIAVRPRVDPVHGVARLDHAFDGASRGIGQSRSFFINLDRGKLPSDFNDLFDGKGVPGERNRVHGEDSKGDRG